MASIANALTAHKTMANRDPLAIHGVHFIEFFLMSSAEVGMAHLFLELFCMSLSLLRSSSRQCTEPGAAQRRP
jgi:hypothetical protein